MVDEIDQSRRSFFRRAAGKAAEKVVEHAQTRIEARAARWIRPPFALSELEFVLACTRCGDCVEACPHKVLFPLPSSYGADVAATAALDVLNGGCHLCEDWPCVAVCEADALRMPQISEAQPGEGDEASDASASWPKMAQAQIIEGNCLPFKGPECGACEGHCPIEGTLTFHREKPRIDQASCSGCGLCLAACIAEPKAIQISSLYRQD